MHLILHIRQFNGDRSAIDKQLTDYRALRSDASELGEPSLADAHVLTRGDTPARTQPSVEPDTPSFLPPLVPANLTP